MLGPFLPRRLDLRATLVGKPDTFGFTGSSAPDPRRCFRSELIISTAMLNAALRGPEATLDRDGASRRVRGVLIDLSPSNGWCGTARNVDRLFLAPVRQAGPSRLDEACLTGNRLRLDRLPATTAADFLTPVGCAAIPRPLTKSAVVALHCIPAPWVRSDRPRSHECHRGREGRGPKHKERNSIMATIGTFTSNANGLGHAVGSVL